MVRNLLRLLFLFALCYLPAKAQGSGTAVIGGACPASGMTDIATSGAPVTCTQNGAGNLVWTVVPSVGISTQISPPCSSSMTLTPGSTFVTDFFINLTCNVTSSTISNPPAVGNEITLSLTQDAIGGRPFTYPTNFVASSIPPFNTAALSTTVSTWQWCGPVGNGNACPANQWQNTDVGPAGLTSGVPFVTSGVTADCPLTETSGATISCGPAGVVSFPGGNSNPVFPSNVPASVTAVLPANTTGTIQGYDNFNTNGSLAGPWSLVTGTVTSVTANVLKFTGTGANTNGIAIYSGNAGYPYQLTETTSGRGIWAQVTLNTAATAGAAGDIVFASLPTSSSGLTCGETPTLVGIGTPAGGLSTTSAHTATAGDVLTVVAFQVAAGTVKVTCDVNTGGTHTQATVTNSGTVAAVTGFVGLLANGTFAQGSPSMSNFIWGTLDYNTTANPIGGLLFASGEDVPMPASLNSSQTIEVYACYQTSATANPYNALIAGNGNGAAGNALGIVLGGSNMGSGQAIVAAMPHVGILSGSVLTTTINFGMLNGCGTVVVVFGASTPSDPDHVYVNGIESEYFGNNTQGASQGLQTVGVYNLGGTPAGSGFASQTFLQGWIGRIRFFSRELTPQEIQQDTAAMQQYMLGRGVQSFSGDLSYKDQCVMNGDSIMAGANLVTGTSFWANAISLSTPSGAANYASGTTACYVNALSGSRVMAHALYGSTTQDPMFSKYGNRNITGFWASSNDFQAGGSVTPAMIMTARSKWHRERRQVGWKSIEVTMISRVTTSGINQDAQKDLLNPAIRQYWSSYADILCDIGETAALGADAANASATFFQGDHIHPTATSDLNIIAPLMQHCINAAYGNKSFSEANTYAATSTAATATTAGSESTNTVTLTMASNPWVVGQCVVVTGVTPAGYNTTSANGFGLGCANVLTATATQITYFNSTTGLGAITIQGTVLGPQEQDVDVYAILGGSIAALNHNLQTCSGRTGQPIYREITNTNAWTITPQFAAETINGGATYTTPVASAGNNPVVRLTPILTSNTAGGCTWNASVQ